MAVMVREAWTDDRMDDLVKHMDGGFAQVHEDLRALRAESREAATRREVRAAVSELRGEMKMRFDKVDGQFDKVDRQFDKVDARFDKVDKRFDKMETRLEKADARFDSLQQTLIVVGGGLMGTVLLVAASVLATHA